MLTRADLALGQPNRYLAIGVLACCTCGRAIRQARTFENVPYTRPMVLLISVLRLVPLLCPRAQRLRHAPLPHRHGARSGGQLPLGQQDGHAGAPKEGEQRVSAAHLAPSTLTSYLHTVKGTQLQAGLEGIGGQRDGHLCHTQTGSGTHGGGALVLLVHTKAC